MVFFMDNTQLNTENSAPWQCTLDTRNFVNGTHTLRAVAYNSVGASTTITRSVNVQNGSASGPTGVTFDRARGRGNDLGLFQRFQRLPGQRLGIANVVFFMTTRSSTPTTLSPWQCTLDTRSFQWHPYAARRGL